MTSERGPPRICNQDREFTMDRAKINPKDDVRAFLSELTELSQRCGIAITGNPVLFLMEDMDRALSYRIDRESNLTFG